MIHTDTAQSASSHGPTFLGSFLNALQAALRMARSATTATTAAVALPADSVVTAIVSGTASVGITSRADTADE
ncbi:hypothetical protein [Mycobacterium sp.]|uniref:hypothetical protein n=1 Tax=Mycobacterium sp. TaxID=1785 RepID=UPI002BA1512A|nr:hypothetical protein [Mycobacterium sp.]HKP41599.1 hypothetical protein [Mycobacterium sp.]